MTAPTGNNPSGEPAAGAIKKPVMPAETHLYRDEDFAAVHNLEMSGGHEPYRSAVFVRQLGIVCHNTFLVATRDGEQVGYAIGALVQDNPRDAWILRIGVREDLRRTGVGSVLLAGLLEIFRTKGVHTVRLTVSPENIAANALYVKAGFVQESFCRAYFGEDGDRIVMVKGIG